MDPNNPQDGSRDAEPQESEPMGTVEPPLALNGLSQGRVSMPREMDARSTKADESAALASDLPMDLADRGGEVLSGAAGQDASMLSASNSIVTDDAMHPQIITGADGKKKEGPQKRVLPARLRRVSALLGGDSLEDWGVAEAPSESRAECRVDDWVGDPMNQNLIRRADHGVSSLVLFSRQLLIVIYQTPPSLFSLSAWNICQKLTKPAHLKTESSTLQHSLPILM